MNNFELEKCINAKLEIEKFRDFSPNGLQVQGKEKVQKIIVGVTACQALIDKAIEEKADAVLVHHGYFWKNEPQIITGMKYRRLKSLLENNINLYAYHLPLDGHFELGNNIQLANLLGIQPIYPKDSTDLLWFGNLPSPLVGFEFREKIESILNHSILHSDENAPMMIKKVAWCTGGGMDFIEEAAQKGADAFISGEVAERTIHIAREYGLHFFAAGHHATERYGIKALGEWLSSTYHLNTKFIDVYNPA